MSSNQVGSLIGTLMDQQTQVWIFKVPKLAVVPKSGWDRLDCVKVMELMCDVEKDLLFNKGESFNLFFVSCKDLDERNPTAHFITTAIYTQIATSAEPHELIRIDFSRTQKKQDALKVLAEAIGLKKKKLQPLNNASSVVGSNSVLFPVRLQGRFLPIANAELCNLVFTGYMHFGFMFMRVSAREADFDAENDIDMNGHYKSITIRCPRAGERLAFNATSGREAANILTLLDMTMDSFWEQHLNEESLVFQLSTEQRDTLLNSSLNVMESSPNQKLLPELQAQWNNSSSVVGLFVYT